MVSKQKVNIGNITYRIGHGKAVIGLTNYNIRQGKTMIGLTPYNINFPAPVNNVYTAHLYSNGTLSYQVNDRKDTSNPNVTVKSSYTGFTTTNYNRSTRPWASQRLNIKNVTWDNGISTANTRDWFYNCRNLVNFSWDGLNYDNIKDMYCMFDYCENLNANTPIKCGNKTTMMAYAYENCKKLVGPAVCGENVIYMNGAYQECHSLMGPPVCGDKVVNMQDAYYNCRKLEGPPVIGRSVMNAGQAYYCCTNMKGEISVPPHLTYIRYMYGYCYNVTGSPKCSDNVINFEGCYAGCNHLTGPFVCGNKVSQMDTAYQSCSRLTGPAIIGPNVTTAKRTFQYCPQITTAGIQSTKIANMYACFGGKNNSKKLTIYAPGNTTTWNSLLATSANNSIVGANITWTGNAYQMYNTAYNIYLINSSYVDYETDRVYWTNNTHVYFINSSQDTVPSTNVATINVNSVYSNHISVPWHASKNYPEHVVNVQINRTFSPKSMAFWFESCSKLTTFNGRLKTDQLTNMHKTFNGCHAYKGPLFLGDSVIDASWAYWYCMRMTGIPVCQGNVINMQCTYGHCENITGSPVCGDLVQDFSGTYQNCTNLTGLPVFGPNVTNAAGTYYFCTNLQAKNSPSIVIGSKMQNMRNTFCWCNKLLSTSALEITITSWVLNDMTNCFRQCVSNTSQMLILKVPHGSYANTLVHQASTYGLTSISWEHPYPNFSYCSTYNIQIYHQG